MGWNPVPFDVGVDFFLVVAIVTERIENLRQSQMRQGARQLFCGHAQPPSFDDRPNRRTSAQDDRWPVLVP